MNAPLATLLLALLATGAGAQSADQRTAPVGVRAHIEQLVLPGSELEARPVDRDSPILLRVVATWPHGTQFRYDLEWVGFEPGTYDLASCLRRKPTAGATAAEPPVAESPVAESPVAEPTAAEAAAPGAAPATPSATGALPKIEVTVTSRLPAGAVEPNELEPLPPPALGGYQRLLVVAAVLWVLGLGAILLVGRRRRSAVATAAASAPTLADRLQPLVEAAQRGELDVAGQAGLERLLLAFWRERIGLGEQKAAAAIILLKQHPEAGALLRQLEAWLHMPTPGTVDVDALLAPYRHVAADWAGAAADRAAGTDRPEAGA